MSHINSVVTDETFITLGCKCYYGWTFITLGSSYFIVCLPQVPLTRNPDPWSEFGLRGNQTFSLLGGIFRGVIFSHIFSRTWDKNMCHLYQSVNKAKGKLENWGWRCWDQRWKKQFTLFVCGEGGITNPLKTPVHQVQDYIGGRGTFALKRGQKWNSPKLVLFHKCFSAELGRISSLLPKWAGHALKAGLPVAVRQLFLFIAVAASEIVTVISSNSSFISFWRSFRGIFWEVLWTLKLTQSQVGIVGFSKNC